MDLGIAGRKAIVCASSRGLGKACARALAEAGCEVVINGRDAKTAGSHRRRNRQGDRRQGHRGRRRRRHAGRAEGAARRLPRPRHPGQQQCRAAAARFPRAHAPADDRRRDRQHDRGGRTDPEGDRPDEPAQVRPHRQHHLRLGEDAARRPRSVVGRARRPDRVPRRRGAHGGRQQRHHQQHPAGRLRHRPPARHAEQGRRAEGHERRGSRQGARRHHSGASVSAIRPSSARPARSCARRRPATSPGRTC